MAGTLPPPPVTEKPGSFAWLEWYRQLRNYVSTSGSVPWYIINFSGSKITDIGERQHAQLQSVLGGNGTEQYHLSAADYTRVAGNLNYQVPLTGFSITCANGDNTLVLDPAGTLASGTVTMPATPVDKQEITISSTQVVTALTVSANTGQTIKGAITTIAANGFAKWKYRSTNTTWYRIG